MMTNLPPNRLERAQATSGFPSPAADSAESSLDVRELVAPRPVSTFYLRMRGDAQAAAGIHAGDVLVVDRALPLSPGKLVIVVTAGELRVTRWPSATADALGGDPDANSLDIE